MAENTKQPLLTITSPEDRDYILIDDKKYEVRGKSEFSLLQLQKIMKIGSQFADIGDRKELSEKEAQQLTDMLNDNVRQILVDADSVIDKLSDMQKIDILRLFPKLLSVDLPAEGEKTEAVKTGIQ